MSSIAIGKISHDPLMIRDAITTHPLYDPYVLSPFVICFPFCHMFPLLVIHVLTLRYILIPDLVHAHNPALYPLVYIPSRNTLYLPRFDITGFSEVTT